MSSNDQFKATRKEYTQGVLDEASVASDPLAQFRGWFDEGLQSSEPEPNACALATVGHNFKPSMRMVLIKSLDESGFVFFTNYRSRKGIHIEQNAFGALLFYWPSCERSVRVEGTIEKIASEESDAYFSSRPRNSQLGALVSAQSTVAESRIEIDGALEKLQEQYRGKTIDRPTHWGGYRLKPELYEFWQGRENRLHDRIQYTQTTSQWKVDRLWP